MTEIDKAYDKVNKEITKSYEVKRENLKNKENYLKDSLKYNVTKIKEQLEIAISDVDNLLKISDKISKGIKLLLLDKEEKIGIKTLSYISQMNKNNKEMRKLFEQLMKNVKISFIEEENTIKYEEYYFNGLAIPKNIEFKDIHSNSFKVLWKIDDINIDKNKIKYKLEIKKENTNDDFIQIYEGKENNYIVNNLENNTNYEIKICSLYKNLKSDFSEIHKVKTGDNVDSIILNESERGKEFLQKLYEWTGYNKMELLYRGTRDGSGANIFHNKCDNQGPTICLCKNEKNNIFGGYSSISWMSPSKSCYKSAKGSFLFTLTNIHKTPPTKYPNTQYQDKSVQHNKNCGPRFGNGNDLEINNDYLNNNNSNASIGTAYPDILGKGNSIFSGDLNTNHFKLKELEVFKLLN